MTFQSEVIIIRHYSIIPVSALRGSVHRVMVTRDGSWFTTVLLYEVLPGAWPTFFIQHINKSRYSLAC